MMNEEKAASDFSFFVSAFPLLPSSLCLQNEPPCIGGGFLTSRNRPHGAKDGNCVHGSRSERPTWSIHLVAGL
jgi:hypothetical protein